MTKLDLGFARPRRGTAARLATAALFSTATLFGVAAAPAPVEPQSVIVVLKDGVDSRAVAREHASRHQANVTRVYEHALKGYAGRMTPGAMSAIQQDGRVAYVEVDQKVSISTTQTGPTWGLDRIDQRSLPLSKTYSYAGTAENVNAYIIDTGINFGHAEFSGRAISGFDSVDGGTADDCNGHGTHVAGTVGGATYGVAKGVKLVAVRVLDCAGGGTWSGVIDGIDWVAEQKQASPTTPMVANMSLGGGASTAVDTAVKNLIAAGVPTAVAAGNGNAMGIHQDACRTSPARVPEAMTISATDERDAKASWANYGNCVDWFAPGVGITAAWHTSSTATNTISGTSMATPHTAGVAALYLQANPAASPATVTTALRNATTKSIVKSSRTANNNLLFLPQIW